MTTYDPRRRSYVRFFVVVAIGVWLLLTALYALVTLVRYDADPTVAGLWLAPIVASVLSGGALCLLGVGFLFDGRPWRPRRSRREEDDPR